MTPIEVSSLEASIQTADSMYSGVDADRARDADMTTSASNGVATARDIVAGGHMYAGVSVVRAVGGLTTP